MTLCSSATACVSRLAHSDLGTRHSLLAQQLVETCDRLQQLSLSQVNLCDEDVDDGGGGAGPQLLRNLLLSPCELKSFRLITSCVSTEGLAHLTSGLGHCHHLEELDFSNNQFHGESACEEGIELLMGTLQGIRRLKRLHLSHFPLGGSALTLFTQGLSHMTALQCLWLSKNSIDDAGCRHLSEALRAATGLEELSLSYNLIGDAGAQLLAAVLLQLPKLRKIDLSWNSIGLEGGTQLAKSLVLCRKLEEVILGHNALGDPTAIGLAQGLPPQLKVLW